MSRCDRGLSAIEVTVAVALVACLATLSAPGLTAWRARQTSLAAGTAVAARIDGVRAAAVTRRRAHAVVFRRHGARIDWMVAVDGDGDGVRSADLDAGVDRIISEPRAIESAHPGVRPGLAVGVPPLGGGRPPRSALPMAPSGILAASPTGSLSTGTVYLCHRRRECFAVRVYGPGGRIGGWQFRAGEWVRRW